MSCQYKTSITESTQYQVALTLWLVGAIPAARMGLVMLAQILGGIAAAAVASAILPGPLPVNVRLGGDTSIVQGLFIEMFTTTQLVFTVIMLAAIKHKATFLAPLGIGLALFIGHLCSKSSALPFHQSHSVPPPLSLTKHTPHPSNHTPTLQASTTPAPASTRPAPSARTSSTTASPATTGSTGSAPRSAPS